MNMTDAELKALIETEPEAGLSRLVDEYSGIVFFIIKNRLSPLCSPEDMEECASDVFFEFFRGISSYDPDRGSIKSYLCSIAKHLSSERFNRASKHKRHISFCGDETLSLIADESSIDDILLTSEARKNIVEALCLLPAVDREIIVRKFYLHEPSRSIAKRLDMSVSAVDTRSHRALKKLKEKIGGNKNENAD